MNYTPDTDYIETMEWWDKLLNGDKPSAPTTSQSLEPNKAKQPVKPNSRNYDPAYFLI